MTYDFLLAKSQNEFDRLRSMIKSGNDMHYTDLNPICGIVDEVFNRLTALDEEVFRLIQENRILGADFKTVHRRDLRVRELLDEINKLYEEE